MLITKNCPGILFAKDNCCRKHLETAQFGQLLAAPYQHKLTAQMTTSIKARIAATEFTPVTNPCLQGE